MTPMQSVSTSAQRVRSQRPMVRTSHLEAQARSQIQLPEELSQSGVEREFRTSMRATKSPREQANDVMREFATQFGAKAGDKKAFHALMKQCFGKGYDAKQAEAFRQRALQGDFSWMPPIQYVDGKTLGGAHGAYNSEAGVIYLNTNLLADPKLAVQVYSEEFGHFLDAKLNVKDSAGDEGELFRRILSGENLTKAQIAEIRAENDHGVIVVDGKEVQVEFWNPFKAIGNAVKKVGKAIGGAVKKVGKAIGGAVKSVGKGIGSIFEGIGNGVKSFFGGIGKGVGGFFSNVFKGKFGEAFKSLGRGLDEAFIKGPTHIFNGFVNSIEHLVNAPTYLFGSLGKKMRQGLARFHDATRSLLGGAWNTVTGIARNLVEGAGSFLGGLGKIFTGDFKGGFKQLGVSLLQTFVQTPVDAILLAGGKALSAIQTLIGVEPVGRKPTAEEIAALRKVYGDSIDYDVIRIKEGDAGLWSMNDRPFVHGNTIYMKDSKEIDVLVHEACHVWQYQNGGSDYMSEALISQEWGKGYDWEQSVPGTDWEDLEPEQQAELIERAWREGYFDPSSPSYGVFKWDTNGDGQDEDLTEYLQTALSQVRDGAGAQ